MPSWMLIAAHAVPPLSMASQPSVTGTALLLITLAVLLGLFFLGIVLLTAIRMRRRRADHNHRRETPPVTSNDPWREAGARLGQTRRRGNQAQ